MSIGYLLKLRNNPICNWIFIDGLLQVKPCRLGYFSLQVSISSWVIITTSRRFKCVFLKWLIPLDVVPWRLSLFLWALLSVASESVSNNFGFIRFGKGEIFWKETSKRLQKTGTILQLRDHGRTDLWTYPFVRDVWMIMKETPQTLYRFGFFATYFQML